MSKEIVDKERKNRNSAFQPLWIGLMLVLGIYIGTNLKDGNIFQQKSTKSDQNPGKLVNIINYIEENYVDSIEKKTLIESAINAMLEDLDPHSFYISAEEFQAMAEPLEGNFEGIGVEFMIQKDTLMVVTPIEGGPSMEAGIQPGDRIVEVDGENIAGIGLTNSKVMKLLKGEKGTSVKLGILRVKKKGGRNSERIVSTSEKLTFNIVRDKIPIESVVAAIPISDEVGYIKVTRFARTTMDEFSYSMDALLNSGMKKLILDLRGNGGGYLNTAIPMVKAFLKKDEMVVYTEGKSGVRREYLAERTGPYANMDVVVLMNQGSASASEILAGALQDHDRALIVGRRSFGKGLVQDEIALRDNSALRLTVARYYTPSGRCIQKPYGDGIDYNSDYEDRLMSGELMNADSVHFPDSLKFKTDAGRTVYGGGGIMPDVFVPLDTTGGSSYLNELAYLGIIRQFGFRYVDENRDALKSYEKASDFLNTFYIDDDLYNQMVKFAASEGVTEDQFGIENSSKEIRLRLKAQIGRNLFDDGTFYRILLSDDSDYSKAIEALKRPSGIGMR